MESQETLIYKYDTEEEMREHIEGLEEISYKFKILDNEKLIIGYYRTIQNWF